jgi:hypothetical protein
MERRHNGRCLFTLTFTAAGAGKNSRHIDGSRQLYESHQLCGRRRHAMLEDGLEKLREGQSAVDPK